MKIQVILLTLFFNQAFGQGIITGSVFDGDDLNNQRTIPGVSVYWLNSNEGSFTDSEGKFSINIPANLPLDLVLSFPGYTNDTVTVNYTLPLKVYLKKSVDLKSIDINARREDLAISTIKTLNTEKITQRELLKAACCNLSEAFETNPSVNVSYKDAVTGVKEIQMLGLGGIYVQMQSENIPDMRGLAGIYGLTYVPGPWIESIQVTKGSGSVVNGFESTTGQINVEYKKPDDKEQPRFFLNLFADEWKGKEANAIFKHKLNSHWSTMLMLHGRSMKNEVDRNDDGFMDIPNNSSVNIYNRWMYHSGNKLESQINFKFLSDEINGGQTEDVKIMPLYLTKINTKRAEVSAKLGFIFPEQPSKSIGNIVQFTYHDMTSAFGLKTYDAKEKSLYVQSIYQNILGQNNHKYRTGFTYRYNLLDQQFIGLPEKIEDNIPGVFFEYTYNYFDELTLVFGARADYINLDQFLFTPRIHGKYNFDESFIFRFSGGKSYRSPYLIADHISVLASSRAIDFIENIKPERAWNYGINFTKKFNVVSREFTFSTDAYRTNFIDQLVVDTYSDSATISYYNLDGKSYSNSLQFTLNMEILTTLNVRLAYKFDDVRSTFNGKIEQQPLISRNRGLATISSSTLNEHWKFDYTLVWEGKKKLQNVFSDPDYVKKEYSPSYFVMNAQVTKVFRRIELYGGVENLLDFRQLDPIIHPENPFGNSFDATNVWGPIQGRRIYAGIRLTIK